MNNGDVQREVKILKTLEKIEEHLSTLVDLAMASGLAASTDRTDARANRAEDLETGSEDRQETRDERRQSREERRDIKNTVEKKI